MPTISVRVTPIPLGFVQAFLLQGERAVLVDTGTPGSESRILRALSAQGIAPDGLALILLTHGHSDHVGGSAALRGQTGAKVAIHARDAAVLRTGRGPKLTGTNAAGSVFSALLPRHIRGFTPFEPDILFEDTFSLWPYGIAGEVVPTPGHTAGSVSVVLEDGAAVVGDAIMGGMGAKGRPRFPMFAEDRTQAAASISKLVGRTGTVYTGHGGPFSSDELRAAL